ncbi:hypothetical protein [Streptosporangium fragile]|uniref:hypothetical protein n=1 Tax=Streptosporangium fragile TaxID=46186 RepID=UPI0031EE424C
MCLRIGRELDPHGAPTYRLEPSDVRTVLLRPAPGVSGRAWAWGKDGDAHAKAFSVDRQVIARDRIHRLTLLTGIVTILRHENDHVEVHAATEAEAARVLTVERCGADRATISGCLGSPPPGRRLRRRLGRQGGDVDPFYDHEFAIRIGQVTRLAWEDTVREGAAAHCRIDRQWWTRSD